MSLRWKLPQGTRGSDEGQDDQQPERLLNRNTQLGSLAGYLRKKVKVFWIALRYPAEFQRSRQFLIRDQRLGYVGFRQLQPFQFARLKDCVEMNLDIT